MRLVSEKGQEAAQDPAHAFPLLASVGLDHEPWRADGRLVEEAATVIRHDTTEQPEGAPEPGLGVEGPVEALRDVVQRPGDRSRGARGVRAERCHRLRGFAPDERERPAVCQG